MNYYTTYNPFIRIKMEQTIDIIRENLKGFELQLFDAAINNLKDDTNILSANNFAFSIRELIRNMLERLAPDNEVTDAPWYKPEKNQNGEVVITRRQRIKYAVQKWFLDDFAKDKLHIALDDYFKDFSKNFAELNKYTHITENTFNIAPCDKTMLSLRILGNLLWFINMVNDAQSEIINRTIDLVDKELSKAFLANHLGTIALTYGSENNIRFLIHDFSISKNSNEILYVKATGYIYVVDPLNDDSYEYKEKKPFVSELEVNYKNKEGVVKIEKGNINIDSGETIELS